MTFGGVKFLLPLNGNGDSLLTPLCLFRGQTMARNFNGGSYSPTGFFLCVCRCARTHALVCELHFLPVLPPSRSSSLLLTVEQALCHSLLELRGHFLYLLSQSAVSALAVFLYACEFIVKGWLGIGGLGGYLLFVAERTLVQTANVSTTITWFAMAFGTNIHGSQRINPTTFGDPLTLVLLPQCG